MSSKMTEREGQSQPSPPSSPSRAAAAALRGMRENWLRLRVLVSTSEQERPLRVEDDINAQTQAATYQVSAEVPFQPSKAQSLRPRPQTPSSVYSQEKHDTPSFRSIVAACQPFRSETSARRRGRPDISRLERALQPSFPLDLPTLIKGTAALMTRSPELGLLYIENIGSTEIWQQAVLAAVRRVRNEEWMARKSLHDNAITEVRASRPGPVSSGDRS